MSRATLNLRIPGWGPGLNHLWRWERACISFGIILPNRWTTLRRTRAGSRRRSLSPNWSIAFVLTRSCERWVGLVGLRLGSVVFPRLDFSSEFAIEIQSLVFLLKIFS